MHSSLFASALLFVVACGGKAVIDPPRDDGQPPGGEAGGAAVGGSSGEGGAGAGGAGAGMPLDGTVRESPEAGSFEMRVASFPMSADCSFVDPPVEACGWFDLSITLFGEGLVAGQVYGVDAGTGQESSFYTSAGPADAGCPLTGGGGPLLGPVRIVAVDPATVTIELLPEWGLNVPDASDLVVGEHVLRRCP